MDEEAIRTTHDLNGAVLVRRSLMSRLGRSTVHGLASASVWHVGNQLVPLLTIPYLARVLGVEGFGILATGVAIAAYAILFTDWGFSLTSMRAVARQRAEPTSVSNLIWSTILAKGLLATLAITLLLVSWNAIHSPVLRSVVAISVLSVVTSILNLEWALRAVDAFKSFAAAALIGRVATIPLIFLLVHTPADVPIAAVVTVMGNIIATSAGWALALRIGLVQRPSLSIAHAVRLIREGAPIFASTAASSVFANAAPVALAAISGSTSAGIYSGSDKMRRPVQGLLSPILIVFFPQFSVLAEMDPEVAHRRILKIFLFQAAIGTLMALGLAAVAPALVPLFLGQDFAPAVPVLQILSGVILFGSMNGVMGTLVMVPFGMNRSFTACILSGMLVGTAVLLPACHAGGAIGAALSAVVAEATVTFAMFVALSRTQSWFRPFAKDALR